MYCLLKFIFRKFDSKATRWKFLTCFDSLIFLLKTVIDKKYN
jgi:hypothetical protein